MFTARDRKSARWFSLPLLYTMVKSWLRSLYAQLASRPLTIGWVINQLRERWSVTTEILRPVR